jgi:glutathione peroxidase
MKMRRLALLVAITLGCFAATSVQAQEKTMNLHQFQAVDIDGKKVDLSKYKGKVVLIVNVASNCGYTKHYKGLQAIQDRYAKAGLVVLGFPCNQFGGQEPGTDKEIKTFACDTYNATFDLFSKVDVNGDKASPIFQWLTSKETNPKTGGQVKWNFEKFVIGRDGALVARFASAADPEGREITDIINQELAKK